MVHDGLYINPKRESYKPFQSSGAPLLMIHEPNTVHNVNLSTIHKLLVYTIRQNGIFLSVSS